MNGFIVRSSHSASTGAAQRLGNEDYTARQETVRKMLLLES